jgi:hypothetical protein
MQLNHRASCRLVVAFVVASAALLQSPASGQQAQDFQWRGTVLQGNTIEIKGVNGDVIAESGTGADVDVSAERKARRSDPGSVRIEVVQHADGVTICAVYPDADGRPNECKPGNEGRMNVRDNDVNVTFHVKVPNGVRFAGRTVNGDVTARSLNGPVSLRTVNGSAEFSTSAFGDASTVNGSIRGSMGSATWSGALEFNTVNGSVALELPADLQTDVRATTVNGDIETDFPLTVTGRFGPRRLTGTIGAGGRSLSIETVNGGVKLRRR